MRAQDLSLPGLILLTPEIHRDKRGYFFESWNEATFRSLTGIDTHFVQDNQSASTRGTLRGLHIQLSPQQGKLVRVLSGEIFDVAVDLRAASSTFGRWQGTHLSSANHNQFWIPEGFAHGFLVLSDTAEIHYKVTNYWNPSGERTIRHDDPDIAIEWPDIGVPLILSDRDAKAPGLGALKRTSLSINLAHADHQK